MSVHDHDHEHRHDHGPARRGPAVRLCDVAVLGASSTLLDHARDLAERRWSVIVVAGDAAPTGAWADVRARGGEILAGQVLAVDAADDGRLRVELTGERVVLARHVLRDGDGLPELDRPPSGNADDWDARYGGDPLWSGNPNGTLVAEVSDLPPGRALDVGAGEGGDALWLAEQGWQVTAADVSGRALAGVSARARQRGVTVTCLQADAAADGAFGGEQFDLVSAQYASIPRTPDHRAERNLLAAVAPGGTLLVVGHDLEPMRAAAASPDAPAFDPDAYVRPEDVAAVLASTPGWTVETHGARPRPAGAASGHHVEDVVLRARRTG